MRALVVLLASGGWAVAPAAAGGSLPLEEAIEFAKSNPHFMSALDTLVGEEMVQPASVVCIGLSLGKQWKHLSSTRIPPFECEIGKRTLLLEGRVEFLDASGKVVGTADNDGAGLTTASFRSARRVRFSRAKWTIK